MNRSLVALCVAWAGSASASGLYFTDNGTKTLLQGGAFTAEADDLTAVQHNPAGLALQRGVLGLVDGQLLFQEVTFQRQNPGFDPQDPSDLAAVSVKSRAPFLLPFFAAGYGFKAGSRRVTLAASVYAPPAPGVTQFDAPNYERDSGGLYVSDPRRAAGHRYMLIGQDLVIAYPTLSAAVELHPKVLLGLSLQLVVSRFKFSTALYSGLTTPQRFTQEDPAFDSVLSIDLPGKLGVTGVAGVLVKPIERLQLGASFRPPFPVRAVGQFKVALGEFAQRVGAQLSGDQAELAYTMPFELRVGARVKPHERLGLNVDFVWQGWSAMDAQVLTPQNVTLSFPGQPPQTLPTFRAEKRWRNTVSVRAGAGFEVVKQLSLHAGFWYETQAAPDEYFNVDFAHAERVYVTGGAGLHLGPIDVLAGVAVTPVVTKYTPNSELRAASSEPSVLGGISGAGIFTTGGWMATLGVRGRFEVGDDREAAPPPPEKK